MKTKTLIRKVNATTIEVRGQKLSLDDTKTVGIDYYVYEADDQPENIFISDKDDVEHANKIGGFHYGLVPADFKARNNIDKKHAKRIRGINAYSIWDDEHRPTCNPKGMMYVPKLDVWIDIYMCGSEHEQFGTSAPFQHFLAGVNAYGRINPNGNKDFLYADFEAVAKVHGKRFITFDEFIAAAKGVKEFASAEDEDDGITRHHPDFVSKYGMEQATGHNWIWSEKMDSDKAVRLGGSRSNGVYSGSRASHWDYYVWHSGWHIGSRFACDSLKPAK